MDHCDEYLRGSACSYHHNQQQRSSFNPTSLIVVEHHMDVTRAELHDRDHRIIDCLNCIDLRGN